MKRQDWRGLGLIALPYAALGALIFAVVYLAWNAPVG